MYRKFRVFEICGWRFYQNTRLINVFSDSMILLSIWLISGWRAIHRDGKFVVQVSIWCVCYKSRNKTYNRQCWVYEQKRSLRNSITEIPPFLPVWITVNSLRSAKKHSKFWSTEESFWVHFKRRVANSETALQLQPWSLDPRIVDVVAIFSLLFVWQESNAHVST